MMGKGFNESYTYVLDKGKKHRCCGDEMELLKLLSHSYY